MCEAGEKNAKNVEHDQPKRDVGEGFSVQWAMRTNESQTLTSAIARGATFFTSRRSCSLDVPFTCCLDLDQKHAIARDGQPPGLALFIDCVRPEKTRDAPSAVPAPPLWNTPFGLVVT